MPKRWFFVRIKSKRRYIINKIAVALKKFPHDYPNKKDLTDKITRYNIHSMHKFKEISSIYKTDNFKLVGSIVINEKKLSSMDAFDYFKDSNNFFDLTSDEDKERLIQVLSTPIKKEVIVVKKEEKTVKSIDEIIYKYSLDDFKDKLENFNSLSPIEQGELFYDVKKLIKERFVSFYKDLGVDKSKVSIRAKLYDLSLTFPEFRSTIQGLKIGIAGCLPKNNKNNFALNKLILEKISSGELKQNMNSILLFINQRKFNDNELLLDNYLIKLRTSLDKRNYSKLSSSDQQRIINHFTKIDNILENKKGN